jgi:hypothetical protein
MTLDEDSAEPATLAQQELADAKRDPRLDRGREAMIADWWTAMRAAERTRTWDLGSGCADLLARARGDAPGLPSRPVRHAGTDRVCARCRLAARSACPRGTMQRGSRAERHDARRDGQRARRDGRATRPWRPRNADRPDDSQRRGPSGGSTADLLERTGAASCSYVSRGHEGVGKPAADGRQTI